MAREPDLSATVSLVAGGYGAIGSEVSRAFAERGSHVVIAGRRRAPAEALASQIETAGGLASALPLDLDDVPAMRAAIAGLRARLERIDFLINCTGRQQEEPLLEVTEAGFDSVVRGNLKGAMFLGQAVAREQIAAGRGGKHVHLLSLRAILGYPGRGYSAFAASKGGVAALIRQHAAELACKHITVNGIAPGIVRTAKNANAPPDAMRRMIEPIPLGRLAEPRDVAQVAVFLCSPSADFVTGQILYLDGGLTSCR